MCHITSEPRRANENASYLVLARTLLIAIDIAAVLKPVENGFHKNRMLLK